MFEVRIYSDAGSRVTYHAEYDTSGEAVDDWTRLITAAPSDEPASIIINFNDRGISMVFDAVLRDVTVVQF